MDGARAVQGFVRAHAAAGGPQRARARVSGHLARSPRAAGGGRATRDAPWSPANQRKARARGARVLALRVRDRDLVRARRISGALAARPGLQIQSAGPRPRVRVPGRQPDACLHVSSAEGSWRPRARGRAMTQPAPVRAAPRPRADTQLGRGAVARSARGARRALALNWRADARNRAFVRCPTPAPLRFASPASVALRRQP